MWDLPGPGLEPMFPALAGGFLTTVPPGKPRGIILEQNGVGGLSAGHAKIWLDE